MQGAANNITLYRADNAPLLVTSSMTASNMPENNTSPLVSIIVRTCNRPRLLVSALRSLAGQDYAPIEVLVVNDGGANVSSVLAEFEQEFHRLRLFSHARSQGRPAALNTGLVNAAGEWLGFLDDDDIFLPAHVSTLIRAAEENRHDFVYGACRVVTIDDQGKEHFEFVFAESFSQPHLLVENYIPLISVLVRRNLVDQVGKFDQSLQMLEDWDWFVRASQYGDFLFVNEITTVYQRHHGSITMEHTTDSTPYNRQRSAIWRKHKDDICKHWEEIAAWFIAARSRAIAAPAAVGNDNIQPPASARLHRLCKRLGRLLPSGQRRQAAAAVSAVTESDFVPFAVSPLPPGPWLVIAPHADDETLGLGGSLLLARQQGISVSLVILTDGAGSCPENEDRETHVTVRKTEAKQAAALLGISCLDFWDQPDRGLSPHPDLVARASRLLDQLAPASVFFPAVTEYHPDHRAAASLFWQAMESSGYTGARFAYEISGQTRINRCIDITDVRAEKERLVAVYQSQLRENCYLEVITALNRSRIFSLPPEIKAAEGLYRYAPGQELYAPLDELQALCRQ